MGNGEGSKVPFDSIVPEAYKNEEWVLNLGKTDDPIAELFKQTKHAQSLVGSRQIEPPGEGATPEQLASFRKSMGVPNDAKGYESKAIEWDVADKPVADYLVKQRPSAFMDELKEAALKANIPKATFESMLEAHDRLAVKHIKADAALAKQAEVANEQNFQQVFDARYGERKNEVINRSGQMAAALLDPQDMVHWNQLDTNQRLLFAGLMNKVHEKFMGEASFNTQPSVAAAPTSGDPKQQRQKVYDLQKQLLDMDKMDPRYDALTKQVKDAYASLPEQAMNKSLAYL
jgi:hypothetical protein